MTFIIHFDDSNKDAALAVLEEVQKAQVKVYDPDRKRIVFLEGGTWYAGRAWVVEYTPSDIWPNSLDILTDDQRDIFAQQNGTEI